MRGVVSKTQMKILILSQFFQPEPIFKGLPLAKELKARGHDVQVLTGFPNYPGGKIYSGYSQRLWKKEEMDGIEVIRVPLYPSHDKSGLRRMANYLSFGMSTACIGTWLVRKPDVVYAYNLVTLGMTLRALRWIRGARTVLDVQDLWPESIASSGMMKSRILMKMMEWWTRMEYRSPSRLIVLSPGFKENLVQRGVAGERIDIVYNWCDEKSINIDRPTNAAESPTEGTFRIVFAGAMGTAQALKSVIDAARKLEHEFPHVRFVFIGGGVEVPTLKEYSASLSNVVFLPPVGYEEIGKVLSSASALLVHLRNDRVFEITIPSKIQAYLYAGKPILCGVAGDAARLVEDARAGLVFQPEDSESLCNTIRSLVSLPTDALQSMGKSGRKFYDEQLSFLVGVDQIESTLECALGA